MSAPYFIQDIDFKFLSNLWYVNAENIKLDFIFRLHWNHRWILFQSVVPKSKLSRGHFISITSAYVWIKLALQNSLNWFLFEQIETYHF